MLTGHVKRDMVGIRDRIDARMLRQQCLHTFQMAVDNRVYQRGEVIMVNQVDGFGIGCLKLAESKA